MPFCKSVHLNGQILNNIMNAKLPVRFIEHAAANNTVVGQAQLDVPDTLNALSLEMIRLLDATLRDWQARDEVAAVIITAAGEKAFCAGGDIQALYHAIDANHVAGKVVDDYAFNFFAEEYRLDYLIHTFTKPLLTLGHGIVMGGGLGIFTASAYRVLTERSRLAVPEITIGLFPDAGASWTLGQMSPHHAAFLGLTGSHLNAQDALTTGMGNFVIAEQYRQAAVQAWLQLPWQGQAESDHGLLREHLENLSALQLPNSELDAVPEQEPLFDDIVTQSEQIFRLEGRSKWIDRGIANLRNGCPTTAGIVLEQLRRIPNMTLADSFRMELTVATHCAQNEDFREGVRALIIEKDNSPKWTFGDLQHLQWQHVLNHFVDPWPEHPLVDLGETAK